MKLVALLPLSLIFAGNISFGSEATGSGALHKDSMYPRDADDVLVFNAEETAVKIKVSSTPDEKNAVDCVLNSPKACGLTGFLTWWVGWDGEQTSGNTFFSVLEKKGDWTKIRNESDLKSPKWVRKISKFPNALKIIKAAKLRDEYIYFSLLQFPTTELRESPEDSAKKVAKCANETSKSVETRGDWVLLDCQLGNCSTSEQRDADMSEREQAVVKDLPHCKLGWLRWRSSDGKVLYQLKGFASD